MVLTEIAEVIAGIMAKLFGFKPEDLNFGAGKAADEVANFADEVGNATNNIDKMKKTMLGLRSFDKIINISNPSDKNSGASGGLGISPELWNMANSAMDEYNKKLDNTKMKATEIRDKIMEWLGFSKQIDEETGNVSFKFDHITSGTVLGALAIGGSIFNGVMKIYNVLSKFGLLKLPSFSGLTKIFSGTSGTSLLSSLSTVLPIVLVVAGEIQAILTDKDLQKQIQNLKKNFDDLKTAVKPLADKILPVLKNLVDGLFDAFKKTIGLEWQKFVDFLGTISELLLNQLNLGIELIVDLVNGDFKKAIDDIINFFGTALNSVLDFVGDVGKPITELKNKIKDTMKEKFKDIDLAEIGKTILDKILNGLFGGIPKAASDFWKQFKDELESSGGEVTIKSVAKGAGKSSLGILSWLFKANGGVYSGGRWHDIQRYDGGGMPNSGQLFWARENGLPELVGTMGGHTAVMNNDQIVGSVASGVYKATLMANNQKQSSNNAVINIYLDKNKKLATYTLNELQSMAKSNGKPIEIS